MTEDRRESTDQFWPRSLTRDDELALALLIVTALAIGITTFAARGGKWVDLDELPPRHVEFQIDLQTAEWPEFTLVPGIGETLAKRIVDSRETQGPFAGPNDLDRVRGIGPVMLERIKPFLPKDAGEFSAEVGIRP